MHTYKLYRSILNEDLIDIKEKLENPNSRKEEYTILDKDTKNFIKIIPIFHKIQNLQIRDDVLWGKFSSQKPRIGFDIDKNEYITFKEPLTSSFCYFKGPRDNYCISYPDLSGRRELRWFFNQTFKKKTNVFKEEYFPENLILDFMKNNPHIAKFHQIPQRTTTRNQIFVIGPNLNKDELVEKAILGGDKPRRSVLFLTNIGWGIRINPRGTIQNYQDPEPRQFIKYLRERIIPLL